MLNYTTKIPAHQSIAEISQILARGGAKAVMHDYDDAGNIAALSFSMEFNGKPIGFKLPANVVGVAAIIQQERVKRNPTLRPYMLTESHATNVTWRVIKDWIESQVALIEANQVTLAQVFLPYAVTRNGQTLYEQIASDPSLLLGPGDVQ